MPAMNDGAPTFPQSFPDFSTPVADTMADAERHVSLLFALTAERLSVFYEHDTWLTLAQGATIAADWLARSKQSLSLVQRKHISALSDELARQIAGSVSRQAGLHIAHEMTESLDERYVSEVGGSMRDECARLLAAEPLPEA